MIEIQKQIFLFVPDFENDLDTYNKVCRQFMEKFFGTEAMLIIVVESVSEIFQYYCYWSVKGFDACHIRHALLNKWGVELVQKVDYLITGISSKNDSFIDVAYRNRVGIISACKDDVFSDFYPSDAVIREKNRMKTLLTENLFKAIPADEYEYIIFHQGMGETLSFLYWMKEYTKLNNRPIAVICMQESRKELLELCPFISYVITGKPSFLGYISVYYGDILRLKNFNCLYYGEQTDLEKRPVRCVVDHVKSFLQLPQEAHFARYDVAIPESAEANATALFEKLRLKKGHTVFIVHNGLNFGDGERNDSFWRRLVNVLKDNGYDVVFNEHDEVYGCLGIFCSIYDTVKFAEACGNVISISTGLTEVICALASKPVFAQFVWPGTYDPFWQSGDELWYRTCADIKLFGLNFVSEKIKLQREYEEQVFSEYVTSDDYMLDMEPEKMEELVQTLVNNIRKRSN